MARLPKCPECEYQVDKDTQRWVKHSAKTYHEHCFQQFEVRKTHRDDLHSYICELYRIEFPTVYMLKQIKDFMTDEKYKQYDFKIKGMEYALRYFHEVKGNSISGQGVGIIPFIYEEARDYYIHISTIKQKASELEYDNKEEVIYIKQPTRKIRKKFIDIEEITE